MTTANSTTTLPKVGTYTIDPAHTDVGFVARHLVGTKVRGRFTDVEGTFTVADTTPGSAQRPTGTVVVSSDQPGAISPE